MSVVCIVQARTGSTRFPGKVLASLAGRPMLAVLLERLVTLRVDRLVVATSDRPGDDDVATLAATLGVAVVRGSEGDVLDRFGTVLETYPATSVVRITADCPLIDPALVSDAIALRDSSDADYVSNTLIRTYPDGLDVEVMRAEVLAVARREARDPVEREHVTPFLYRRPGRFRLVALRGPELCGDERWTVDRPEDLQRLDRVLSGNPRLLRAPWPALLDAMGRVAPPPPDRIHLRPVRAADADLLLGWRNDAGVVATSGTGRGVEPDEHRDWFAAVVDDPGRRIWIAELAGRPVGQVRVDVEDGCGTVSISIDAAARGQGLAAPVLAALHGRLSTDEQVTRLVADIAADNLASQRAFARVGYEAVDRTGEWLRVGLARGSGIGWEFGK